MKLTPLQPTTILYEGANGTSSRTILPVKVPQDSVLALDLNSVPVDERQELIAAYTEYQEYVEQRRKSLIFSFENWLEQAKPTVNTQSIAWRTFKIDKIK